ncbi:MAG: DEAD/DEAH box helicase family protein [Armatimonadetes bacterium]|nr:DEAD/DEAH box helicase family protein [Armatimonadota bacterium]
MVGEVVKLLGPEGRFASLCPEYEHRPEQLEMAKAVAEALVDKRHLVVEAGTGVGKTIAYLMPAVLYAISSGRRVVVSTHTINLQSQLVNKDIPLVQQAMEEHPFTTVLMKGRANFLCLNELDNASSLITTQDDKLFERLRKWASKTETGDIGELDFVYPDWHEVCSNQDTCRRDECRYHADKCFYYRMRKRAETADIVVVNHSLFFSDLGLRMVDPKSAVIPKYGAVIFDEAHHLEDVASDTFGIEFSNYRVTSLVNRLKKRRDLDIPPGELHDIQTTNDVLFNNFDAVRKQEFFIDEVYEAVGKSLVEEQVKCLVTQLNSLNAQLAELQRDVDREQVERIHGYRNIASRMSDELFRMFFASEPGYFRWAEKLSGSRLVRCCLHYSPVSVASLLRENLWNSIDTVICTSATLSNSGTFCYLRSRLGVPECDELILGSPFDFENQALLYVPDDLDDPSEKPEYADSVAARIKEILIATGGRAFMLFTSYRMLNAVFDRLKDDLPFRLLRQGEMSNERLLKEFREDESTCLMGVHSFWEGVDVKGERLSCVVIDKLPFAVPDTPTNKARCQQITQEGGDWFREYAIPQAQIRLKQGFGRLIRTKNDCGVVAILDSRIHRKYYGREFLRYLPRCRGTKSLDKIRQFMAVEQYVDVDRFAVADSASSTTVPQSNSGNTPTGP